MSFLRRMFGQSKRDDATEAEGDDKEQEDTVTDESSIDDSSGGPSATASEGVDARVTLSSEETFVDEKSTSEFPPLVSLPETAPFNPVDGATRPLKHENLDINNVSSKGLLFGMATDKGMVRTNNQDASFAYVAASRTVDEFPDFGLFIVADGMGGYMHGEKAAAIATRIVANAVLQQVYIPLLTKSQEDETERPTISEVLIKSVKDANQQILKHFPGAGTTATIALIIGDLVHVAHVGDSRAYLVAKQNIEQLSRDHSLVQRLIELNQLTQEERNEHQHRNVLYRAVGQNDELEVDTLIRRIPHNSYLLLCSDGLWGEVSQDAILETVTSTKTPQDACKKLISLANSNGGQDNITAVLVRVIG